MGHAQLETFRAFFFKPLKAEKSPSSKLPLTRKASAKVGDESAVKINSLNSNNQ